MEIKMAKTAAEAVAEKAAKDAALARMFEDIKEMQRTQPGIYQAICDYGTHVRNHDTDQAFQAAGEIARRVQALAAGLPYEG